MPEQIKRELLAIAEGLEGLLQWEAEHAGDGFPTAVADEVRRAATRPAAQPAIPQAIPQAAPLNATALPALHVLQEQAASCTACELHRGRTHSVFARGNPAADVVFVGEGPGYHEDQAGLPFVGPAGQLLDKMIVAMGYQPDDVYVCNVVKCRPPDNRTPLDEEAEACLPYLRGQLAHVRPRVIVTLGKCATEALRCMTPEQKKWRGVWSEYAGVPVMPTYHPAFLLRSPQFKRDVWEDLQLVMARVGTSAGTEGAR